MFFLGHGVCAEFSAYFCLTWWVLSSVYGTLTYREIPGYLQCVSTLLTIFTAAVGCHSGGDMAE